MPLNISPNFIIVGDTDLNSFIDEFADLIFILCDDHFLKDIEETSLFDITNWPHLSHH